MDTKDAGRLGGITKTEKKTAAARQNGKKGGRPRIMTLETYLQICILVNHASSSDDLRLQDASRYVANWQRGLIEYAEAMAQSAHETDQLLSRH